MKKIIIGFGCLLFLIFLSNPVFSGCKWEWVCDEDGDCEHQPICDSSIDLAPVEPPEVKPIVPPALEPLPPIVVPPIGTKECKKVRLCDTYGNCRWDTVCE
ncbi:MAG TPA: hypothetical protein VGB26_03385 [Nitrospiria bacterium]|jgi:hypothetical protein